MSIIARLLCLIGIHNWWDAGGGEYVCLDCGNKRRGRETIDLPKADTVEITISRDPDGSRLWLHADGKLIARIYRIGRVIIDDRRTKPIPALVWDRGGAPADIEGPLESPSPKLLGGVSWPY